MHLLVVNNVVSVSFQLSGNKILSFPSDDEMVLFRKESSKNMDLNAISQASRHIKWTNMFYLRSPYVF